MFDAVLAKSRPPQGNVAGLALSLGICGLFALGGALLLSSVKAEVDKSVDVTLFTAPPPPPPPPPPAGGARVPQVEKKVVPRKRDTVIQPKVQTEDVPKPTEEPPTTEPDSPGGVEGGVPGGVPGGVVGGVPGGVVGGVLGGNRNAALPFGVGMTRPQQLSSGQPQYTRPAIAARVEGKVIVRCTITLTGEAQDCKVIKGVPMLEQIVLDWLRNNRYAPATYQGRAVAVQYVLTFNFKLP
jgi:protein TonB